MRVLNTSRRHPLGLLHGLLLPGLRRSRVHQASGRRWEGAVGDDDGLVRTRGAGGIDDAGLVGDGLHPRRRGVVDDRGGCEAVADVGFDAADDEERKVSETVFFCVKVTYVSLSCM